VDHQAVYSAIVVLVRLHPERVLPLFISHGLRTLDSKLYENIGPEELRIWQTPEGVLAINGNVLSFLVIFQIVLGCLSTRRVLQLRRPLITL
jgi:hypothetical protein